MLDTHPMIRFLSGVAFSTPLMRLYKDAADAGVRHEVIAWFVPGEDTTRCSAFSGGQFLSGLSTW
jgi:hypothetical protein